MLAFFLSDIKIEKNFIFKGIEKEEYISLSDRENRSLAGRWFR